MAGMSDINPDAAARRDAARVNGRFGEQDHTAPEIVILSTVDVQQQHIEEALKRKAVHLDDVLSQRPGPGEKLGAGELAAGDTVLTETNTANGPFSWALRTSRDTRRRWKAAGMPLQLTVLSRRRAPEDGHTDDEVTFDLNGEPLVLTFHRERVLTIA